MDKLYVNFKVPDNLHDFLTKFFSNSSRCRTSYRGVATFADEACNEQQCDAGRRRSFEEVCICARTYFPKVTDKEVLDALLGIHLDRGFYPFYCRTINKPVMEYYTIESLPKLEGNIQPFDETRGLTKQSWVEIWKIHKGWDIPAQIQQYRDNLRAELKEKQEKQKEELVENE